jgi:hypothetical protein
MDRFASWFRSSLILFGISCVVLLACSGALGARGRRVPANGAARAVVLGREFELRPGQQARLMRTKLRITFMNVKDDSRCPKDVTCVWAGNATVRLWVTDGRGGKSLTLNTNKSPTLSDEAQYQEYKIKLVDLSPYPRSDQKIAKSDYTATLLVSKK